MAQMSNTENLEKRLEKLEQYIEQESIIYIERKFKDFVAFLWFSIALLILMVIRLFG